MKLTKDHVGKKVRKPKWKPEQYEIVAWVGNFFAVNIGKAMMEYKVSLDGWELFQERPPKIPENQAWVVVGKKYFWKNDPDNWFIPQFYDHQNKIWAGVSNKHQYVHWMDNKSDWTDRLKVKVKMAPGIVYSSKYYQLTPHLFENKQDFDHWCSHSMNVDFGVWPANDNAWVEVEKEVL